MSKNAQFQKFINQKSNAARKEEFKREKKAVKKERAAAIERRYEEKRQARQSPGGSPQSTVHSRQPDANGRQPITRNSKPDFNQRQPVTGVHKAVGSRQSGVGGRQSAVGNQKPVNREQRPVANSNQYTNKSQRPYGNSKQPAYRTGRPAIGSQKPVNTNQQPVVNSKQLPGKNKQPVSNNKQPETRLPDRQPRNLPTGQSAQKQVTVSKQPVTSSRQPAVGSRQPVTNSKQSETRNLPAGQAGQKPATRNKPETQMPLNKYIAHSGICSRRDAAGLVKRGEVMVNNKVITEPGYKTDPRDTVTVKGKKITPSRSFVYILLNKPKDYLTTMDDPEGRKTVLDLIKHATQERVYPVGRLDRNTSGVLLLTNDGDLAQTLSHPKHEIKKIYEVRLDKPLTKVHFEKLLGGLTLEDGFIAPDALGYVEPKDKSIIGIEIHSGRNRIVRRIFEALGYDVRNLDRVMYAGLTKKNVQRGKWRLLTEKEIRIIRHFNPQTKKSKN